MAHKRKQTSPKMKRKLKPAESASGRMIQDLMRSVGADGSYKDYVVIAGNRLVDWRGSYDIKRAEDSKSVGIPDGVALIHKRKLKNVIGDGAAKMFWRPGVGRVGSRSPRKPEAQK
jgi:hypothetical protein